jgi:IS30 family transposase
MSNLTYYERQQIELWNKTKLSIRVIASLIHRDHTVVSRELKRNNGALGYNARLAQEAADRRSKKTNKCKLDKHPELKKYVEEQLKEDWSPETIAGRIKKYPPPKLKGITISHEQIYQYCYKGGVGKDGIKLYINLPNKKCTRQRRSGPKQSKSKIPDRISIEERLPEIDLKLELGHWESDLMFAKGTALSVQYERSIQLVRIHKLENRTAISNTEAILKSMDTLPGYLWKSITFDNGLENALHTSLGLLTYFCHAYASWEKGGVENMNGLIRRYVTRQTDLSQFTDRDIEYIQERLNNRPRKGLGYMTPNERLKAISGALNS